jgi:hypothetical protein
LLPDKSFVLVLQVIAGAAGEINFASHVRSNFNALEMAHDGERFARTARTVLRRPLIQ